MCYGICCDFQRLWKISISEISDLVSFLGDLCLGGHPPRTPIQTRN